MSRFTLVSASVATLVWVLIILFPEVSLIRKISWSLAILLLWSCFFVRGIPYRQSVILFAMPFYLIGAIELFTSSDFTRGALILGVVPFFVTQLIGIRGGGISFLITMIVYISNSLISTPLITRTSTLTVWNIGQLVIFLVLGLGIVYIINRYRVIIDEISSHKALLVQELKENKTILNSRISARKEFIRRSTDLNQHISNILDEGKLAQRSVNGILATQYFSECQLYILPPGPHMPQRLTPAYGGVANQNGSFGSNQEPIYPQEPPYKTVLETLEPEIISPLDQAKYTEMWGPILGEEVSGELLEELQMTLLDHQDNSDAENDEDHIPTRFKAVIPIFIRHEKLGILLVSRREGNIFSSDELFFLRTVASQIAICIRNARVFTRANRIEENEQIIETLSQEIQNATTIQETLEIVTRMIGEQLGGDVKISLAESYARSDKPLPATIDLS